MNTHHPLVAGKKCVVVAPSRYLRGRGTASAKFINSFDLVVKTTDMCEMRDPIGELGERCDIWYGMPGNASGWRVDLKALHRQGTRLMVLQPQLEQYSKAWQEYVEWLNHQSIPPGIDIEFAEQSNYRDWVEKCDGIPLSGVFAILDLLAKGAKSVFAYGHDFYRTGYFFDSDFEARTQISDWHKMDSQMALIWHLYKNEERFDCDMNLQYLLLEKFSDNFEPQQEFARFIQSELTFFARSFPFRNAAIVRTCNIKWFNLIINALRNTPSEMSLDVIVQEAIKEELEDMQEGMNLKLFTHGDRFTYEGLEKDIDLTAQKLDTVFIPYNGLELWTYLDVFEYFLKSGAENVFLISLRGIVRRIENLQHECDSMREYVALRNRFNQYVQRYDRRQCL